MEALNFYNERGDVRHAKARLLLSLFSQDMVADIISLVQTRGRYTIEDVFENTTDEDPARVFACLSEKYMAATDMPKVLLGLSTILLCHIRTQKYGVDEYAGVLRGAYGLPEGIASAAASQVETADSIPWKDFGTKLMNYANRLVNWVPRVLQIPWEMDETQEYDTDFLFELSNLGDAVIKLNRRARLMVSQQQINTSLSSLSQSGDPQDELEVSVGDALYAAGLNNLPAEMYGNKLGLAKAGQTGCANETRALLNSAGIYKTSDLQGDVDDDTSNPETRKRKRRLQKLLRDARDGKAERGVLRRLATSSDPMMQLLDQGDPTGTIPTAKAIGADHGGDVADAWLMGDVDELVRLGLREIGDVESKVGPNELKRLVGTKEDHLTKGDVEDLSPEMGDLFGRYKLAKALKNAARKRKKAVNKGSKLTAAANKKAARLDRKRALRDAIAQAQAAGAEENAAKYYRGPSWTETEDEEIDLANGSDLSGFDSSLENAESESDTPNWEEMFA